MCNVKWINILLIKYNMDYGLNFLVCIIINFCLDIGKYGFVII